MNEANEAYHDPCGSDVFTEYDSFNFRFLEDQKRWQEEQKKYEEEERRREEETEDLVKKLQAEVSSSSLPKSCQVL